MSIKTERLANVLHREISDIFIREVKNDDLKFLTITNVVLSSDLSYAKVYFTSLNSNKEEILKTLNGSTKNFIRSELINRKIEMRNIPELSFIYDDSIEYGNNIERIINELHEEK